MGYFGIPFRNGVPIGLGSIVGFGAPQEFSPSELFLGGTAGAWYDPSDLSTLFTTSAGTTQCAMPGQGSAVSVGLMLDKSQGLVLGPELVTNGDFSSGSTGWSLGSGWSTGSGQATFTNPGFASPLTQNNVLSAGKRYLLSFTVSGPSINVRPYLGTYTGASFYTVAGTYSFYFFAGADTTFGFQGQTGATFSIDNISVRELPGNHAIAFNDTTARPELRARVNLLTYSEEFDNAAWAKSGATVTANAVVAPDGTTTADKLVETATTASHFVNQGATLAVAVSFKASVYVKAAERNFARLSVSGGAASLAVAVNLTTGQLSSVVDAFGNYAGVTVTATNVGNGWWLVALTATRASGGSDSGSVGIGASDALTATGSYAGDITKGIYIWGADLRPANIGANVPVYQRIADANTYDTSGFPLYLFFDGIDDSMYTPANLNLSGTDKVAVFAGVRKLSDASRQIITELSSNFGLNLGTFVVIAADSAGANYYLGLQGTGVGRYRPTTYAAPISNVLATSYDIGGATLADEIRPQINGVLNQTNASGLAGTGNLGSYPLYIGSRGNASDWFNGNIYSLIIAGSAVSAGNITATEQWVAGRTGISIP